jgi:flagellar motility protein MotE (MotC chaperone)
VKSIAIPLIGSLIGGLLYLAVTAALIVKGYKPPAPPPAKAAKAAKVVEKDGVSGAPLAGKTADELNGTTQSWNYYNGDIEFLITYLKETSNLFRIRQKDLDELGQRLAAERAELASVTQSVARLRDDIDRQVIRIQDDEAINVKRLAKTYAGMEPSSVAKIFAELDEKLVVKVMSQMKDDQNAPILDALTKTGVQGAKLAAVLSDKLRLVPTGKKS